MPHFLFAFLPFIWAQAANAQGAGSGDPQPMSAAGGSGSTGFGFLLAIGIIAAVVLIAGGVGLAKLLKSRKGSSAASVAPRGSNSRPNGSLAQPAHNPAIQSPGVENNLPLPAPAAPKPRLGPTPLLNPKTNGRHKPVFSSRFSRRRKEFDYNRYFADLMATVSGHVAAVEAPPNGYAVEVTRLAETVAASTPSSSSSSNSELIANQTTLIEEQRRLIQEQTRLIEEKAKLIAEKNELLKTQERLIEQKLG